MPAALEYVKHHPWQVAGGVIIVGLVVLYATSSSSSSGSSDSGLGADYLAAQSAQAQAGDALQIAQIQAQAGTAQTELNDQASVSNTAIAAGSDLAATENTNATQLSGLINTNTTQVQLAPFAVQAGVVSGLSEAALTPPIPNTTPGNSGFFGLFSTGPTTTTTPSPTATSAVNQLDTYLNGFAPGH
jgi:multidrug efflux pump subunit AcrA (membrane-fusion protein)